MKKVKTLVKRRVVVDVVATKKNVTVTLPNQGIGNVVVFYHGKVIRQWELTFKDDQLKVQRLA